MTKRKMQPAKEMPPFLVHDVVKMAAEFIGIQVDGVEAHPSRDGSVEIVEWKVISPQGTYEGSLNPEEATNVSYIRLNVIMVIGIMHHPHAEALKEFLDCLEKDTSRFPFRNTLGEIGIRNFIRKNIAATHKAKMFDLIIEKLLVKQNIEEAYGLVRQRTNAILKDGAKGRHRH